LRRAARRRQKQSPGRKRWLETGARIGIFNFPSSQIARLPSRRDAHHLVAVCRIAHELVGAADRASIAPPRLQLEASTKFTRA
jgi:hypothetical protein